MTFIRQSSNFETRLHNLHSLSSQHED